MKNEIKIGVGVVLLVGVGYYFYNKNKSKTYNVNSTSSLDQSTSTLDKEKLAKEFATFAFPIFNKKNKENIVKTAMQGAIPIQAFATDSQGNSISVPISKNEPITELFLYKRTLEMLNGISNDSDALFILNEFKKSISLADDRNYKPDLDTQIRLEKIQNKYPNALKLMSFIGS